MKVLLAHERYLQAGGEDLVFEAEARLLEERGHQVVRYVVDNARIEGTSRPALAAATLWSRRSFEEIRTLIRQSRPEIVHFHNTFPLISPAAYYAAAREGTPVVQTLHNYRLACANALLVRRGRPCEACVGRRVGWPGVLYRCYRDSRVASAGVVAMQSLHRLLRTWSRRVDAYVAPSAFARRKLVEGGLPAGKIEVNPHHVAPDPGPGDGGGRYCAYVGRLSAEKGVRTLLRAWRRVGEGIPLLIAGEGPLDGEVREAAAAMTCVRWLGPQSREGVMRLLGDARCLVFPSECYETFGRTIVEALARGTPVVAVGHGAAAELVQDGRTGLHFRPGDAASLAAAVQSLWREPAGAAPMREEARLAFLRSYTADAGYRGLMRIYRRARETAAARHSSRWPMS